MTSARKTFGKTIGAALAVAGLVGTAGLAQAATNAACPNGMRKINIGVAVSPPNVVHTTPYVARDLGIFAKHCIDPHIIQFDGGAAGTAITAVAQGSAISNLPAAPIARGIHAREIWGMAPHPPQSYMVDASIKTFKDLKGKRLSAAGGIGGYNWLMGRDVLKKGGLTVNDATFISQGTAGRLPGLLTGQLDGVVLHPEDVYLAQQKKKGLHPLIALRDLMPNITFNAYGAADSMIAKDKQLLIDTVASMIEADRIIYKDKDKVLPIMIKATGKPKDAVEYAYNFLTKNCIWAVNTGFDRKDIAWSIDNDVRNGDIKASQKPTVDQVADFALAEAAVKEAGGPVKIGACSQ